MHVMTVPGYNLSCPALSHPQAVPNITAYNYVAKLNTHPRGLVVSSSYIINLILIYNSSLFQMILDLLVFGILAPILFATLGPTWNSTLFEFQLASLNLQVGPRSGMIMYMGPPTHPVYCITWISDFDITKEAEIWHIS